MIAGQRAWVKAELSPGPLILDQNGASFTIDFRMTNTGQAPATNITAHAWLLVLKNDTRPWEEVTRRCDEIRKQQIWSGFSLFPGDRFPDNVGLGGFGVSTNVQQSDITEALEISTQIKALAFFVIGCVDYTFATDSKNHHQTRFILSLNRIKPSPLITPDNHRIEKTDLILTDTLIGGGSIAD
jgi:hypothetical protein